MSTSCEAKACSSQTCPAAVAKSCQTTSFSPLAPYFRVFNPTSQLEKFDKELRYVRKWVPEYGTSAYPNPIVDHKTARLRAIDTYQSVLKPSA